MLGIPIAGFVFAVISVIALITIVYFSFTQRLLMALTVLIVALPVFGLAKKAFSETPLFPSFETLSVIFILIGFLVVHKTRYSISQLGRNSEFLLCVFLLAGLLSTVYSKQAMCSTYVFLTGCIAPSICYIITIRLIKVFSDIESIILAYLTMVVLIAIYCIMNYYARFSMGIGMNMGDFYSWVYNEYPIVNVFTFPSATTATVISGIPLSLWYGKHGVRYPYLITTIALLSCFLISLFSFSRGAWISILFIYLLSLIVLFHKRLIKVIGYSMIGLLVSYSLNLGKYISPILEYRELSINIFSSSNAQVRAGNYMLAINSFWNHLFIGYGLGSYSLIYKEMSSGVVEYVWFAHSLFLTLIPEIGGAGTIAFVLFFLVHLFRPTKSKCNKIFTDLDLALKCGIIGYILIASTSGCHLVNYVDNPYYITYFGAPALIVVSIFMGIIARPQMQA